MANGTYGTRKPAVITSNDVEIFYYYRPSRTSESVDFSVFKQLDSNLLNSVSAEDTNGSSLGVLPGMYDLRLPLNVFNEVGFYTVYIKPKEILTTIVDVSTLSAFPSIRGIVINTSKLGTEGNNGNLTGYRVEYFDNGERLETYRLITSNNHCEPVAQNLNNAQQKGITYILNENSNLTVRTLTPSTNLSFNTNGTAPFIGNTGQKIALVNTKFNPIMLEIEIVEHDIESVSTMLEGEQLRDLDHATITTFDKNGSIYSQSNYGHILDQETGINYDFKVKGETIINNENDLANIKQTLSL